MRDLARAPIGTVRKRLGAAWLIAVCLAAGNWSVAGFFFVGHRVPLGPSPRAVTLKVTGLPAKAIHHYRVEIEVEARVPFPAKGGELEITYRLTEPEALGISSSSALRAPGRRARRGAGARAR